MQADRWKKVEELFEAALAQPPGKREAFVEQACSDDLELRSEVQSLLNLVPSAASFLEGADFIGPTAHLGAGPRSEAREFRDSGSHRARRHGRGLSS